MVHPRSFHTRHSSGKRTGTYFSTQLDGSRGIHPNEHANWLIYYAQTGCVKASGGHHTKKLVFIDRIPPKNTRELWTLHARNIATSHKIVPSNSITSFYYLQVC
jgi:hypothetical protein